MARPSPRNLRRRVMATAGRWTHNLADSIRRRPAELMLLAALGIRVPAGDFLQVLDVGVLGDEEPHHEGAPSNLTAPPVDGSRNMQP